MKTGSAAVFKIKGGFVMNDIKGLSHLKFQFTRARTVLTGGGGSIAALKRLAEDRVSLCPYDVNVR